MQAIILAAGMGTRLKDLTRNNTKCMIKVNGVTLIERMLHQIKDLNISRIVLVVGYKEKELVEHISSLNIPIPIIYVKNPIYNTTNNIYSLYLAKKFLCEDDTLLFESDLIFEDAVLQILYDDPRDTLVLVDKYKRWMDGTCVKIDKNDTIIDFFSQENFCFEDTDMYYKTVNIYKFSKDFSEKYYIPFLEAYSKALGNNKYYEQVLNVITRLDAPIKAKRLTGQKWYEIDDIEDLEIAVSIFMRDKNKKTQYIQDRFGGYWRYPELLDFCYLVNPYFPPQKLKNEIKANFDVLLESYPSGMRANSMLAAKNFNVKEENILLGNGAAELIKSLMENLNGKTGFIRPTFEEYQNRYNQEESIIFCPKNKNFSYLASDIQNFFSNKNINQLILINPDNPSGNYIAKQDVITLAKWTQERNIIFILDESFVDFAEEKDSSFIDMEILKRFPSMFVVKSISKSHGVPGLRLGVLASGNIMKIAKFKKDVSIWNINSFGEFYLQIFEKYKKDFIASLQLLKTERNRFIKELSAIEGLRTVPSQANYVLCELTGAVGASELTKNLLTLDKIFIKDLSSKITTGEYIRVAVRNQQDNDNLIKAIKKHLNFPKNKKDT